MKSLKADQLMKYAGRVPRYTSYPTANLFANSFVFQKAIGDWSSRHSVAKPEGVSLYIHVPFCRSLCWYCACNVTISRDQNAGSRFTKFIKKELRLLASEFCERVKITEVVFGGGSPNFLTSVQFKEILSEMKTLFRCDPDFGLGVELDPRETKEELVASLGEMGVGRLSVGVQDFSKKVQTAINRHQTFEQTLNLIESARDSGVKSTNIDLVYGLACQTRESFTDTLSKINRIKPERVALFGYAHLPNIRPQQKLLTRHGKIPGSEIRAELLLAAKRYFEANGYLMVGIDHFALKDDELARGYLSGRIHRNFQGYVPGGRSAIIGLGPSAISDFGGTYWQNYSDLGQWEETIEEGGLPVSRGITLSRDDLIRREVIEGIMCTGVFDLGKMTTQPSVGVLKYFEGEIDDLETKYRELVTVDRDERIIRSTPLGKILARTTASVFDKRNREGGTNRFSLAF